MDARETHAAAADDVAAQDCRQVDLLASVLLALETAPAAGFRLAAAAVIEDGAAAGVIRLVLGQASFRLTPDETRMLARYIGFEDQRRATGMLVSLFQAAACDAEEMAADMARRASLARTGQGAAA